MVIWGNNKLYHLGYPTNGYPKYWDIYFGIIGTIWNNGYFSKTHIFEVS